MGGKKVAISAEREALTSGGKRCEGGQEEREMLTPLSRGGAEQRPEDCASRYSGVSMSQAPPLRGHTRGLHRPWLSLGHLCPELHRDPESVLVRSGNRAARCPPPPARRPTELNYHIGNSKVNTNR